MKTRDWIDVLAGYAVFNVICYVMSLILFGGLTLLLGGGWPGVVEIAVFLIYGVGLGLPLVILFYLVLGRIVFGKW